MSDLFRRAHGEDDPEHLILFRQKDHDGRCAESRDLLDWGELLIKQLRTNPSDGAIGWAKAALLDNYAERDRQMTAKHRELIATDQHSCLHEALINLWLQIRNVRLQRRVPELDIPECEPVHVQPFPSDPQAEQFDDLS